MDTESAPPPSAPPEAPAPASGEGGDSLAAREAPDEASGVSVGVRETAEPLHRVRGWIRVVGAAGILYGVLSAFTVVGLLVAWIPIWAGIALLRASGNARRAHDEADAAALGAALRQIRSVFVLGGVFALLAAATTVTVLLVSGAAVSRLLEALNP